MILAYGPYRHAQNEVSYAISRQALRSQGGAFYAYRERWDCSGTLLNYPSQAALTAAINALCAAYSSDGFDLVHYLDDGATPTAHRLISANCNGGTRIVRPPSFADTYGTAEYSTFRSYQFAVEAEVPLTNSNVVLHFSETLVYEGNGGPVRVWIPVAQGPWIRQETSEASTFRVVQSGTAVGLYGPPAFPQPLWPDAEIFQLRRTEQSGPRRLGRFDWPISWSYTFESSGSLVGQTNPYPQ